MRLSFLVIALALPALFTAASSPEEELAEGIFYTQDVTRDPPPSTTGMVYDLRDSVWTDDNPRHFQALFAESHPLSVVLLRSTAPAEWFNALADRSHRVILVTPISPHRAPDVAVPVTPDEVSAALHEIASGTDIASLALPEIAKRRFDEAVLVSRHRGSNDSVPSPDEPVESESLEANSPPIPDLMLQRAVQILQGLEALGRG